MIGKIHRFHGLGSLRFAYRQGKMVRGSLMSVKYNLDTRRSSYRLAVVVSKKVSKSAVVRNRIRRRIMEVVRQEEAKITEPYDLIVTVFSDEVADMPAKELAKTLKSLLTQASVIS